MSGQHQRGPGGAIILQPAPTIETVKANLHVVQRMVEVLRKAYQDEINAIAEASADKKGPSYVDCLMVVHNFHKLAVLDMVQRCPGDSELIRTTAVGKLAEALQVVPG
jgi:hypothetical protein